MVTLSVVAALPLFAVAATPSIASAAPSSAPSAVAPSSDKTQPKDELPNAAESKRRELREQAVTDVISGRATPEQRGASTVVKVGTTASSKTKAGKTGAKKTQYVELARETTDKVFVILTEFGTDRDPNYPDQDTDPLTPGPTVFNGPLHNAIPEPDRTQDNSTVWQANYTQAFFQNLYFGTGAGVESLKTYYERQSSGRYSVTGQVSDWVKVKYNEARYGRSNGYPCAGIVCSNTWNLIQDAVNQWVADQHAAGKTDAQIKTLIQSYDQWDRNDFDGDGNFNEPDGYIDHFQIVHAGGDQADGDPYQGEDAIWSHRWKAFQNQTSGPVGHLDGGTQVGNTGIWVADYTIQPENGGGSVIFHEYGHDLGLPDHYDTATGGSSPVEWWSLMAQSRASAKGDVGIGTRAADLSAWDKLQLGWLDYEVTIAGQSRTYQLGPHEYNSVRPQAIVVVLPKKEVTTSLGEPFAGTRQWWSGGGDDLNTTMSRQVTLPAAPATLRFQARWNIEDCGPDPCDYAYVEVDDGTGWAALPGSITHALEGNGIDGLSDGWTPATFDLASFAGKTVNLRVRYTTDGAAQGTDPDAVSGLFVDDLSITAGGATLLSDGAETSPNGWTLAGFSSVAGAFQTAYDNFYIASWRTYVSYDRYLKYGPYNFGFTSTRPDWVEHFPYQQGLLISYWNTQFSDNNVSTHPGEGQMLTIDAHPQTLYRLDGTPWRTRVQIYDAPFSRTRADSLTLHINGQTSYIRGQAANPVFDDTKNYFDPVLTDHGVKVANAGVKITVLSTSGTWAKVKVTATTPRP